MILAGLAAGCTSLPSTPPSPDRRALRPVPALPAGNLRADHAVVGAFFAANGIPLTPAELEEIIPPAALDRKIDRRALRRIATARNRVLIVIKADERYLWEELGRNRPLLVLMPPDLRYHPRATPMIPVAWERGRHAIELLDGKSGITTMPEETFFGRRLPLKQAALCLVRPAALARAEPTREEKLVLADFWYDKGFYRRAGSIYAELAETSLKGIDVEALTGRANALVRKGRYAEAITVYRAALALQPENPKILNNLAYAMLEGNGELLTALRHATKADHLDPGNPVILETIGAINLRLGDAETAARYFERAWARATQHSPEIQVAIMDQLVRAWLGSQRPDLAWQVAETRQRNFPQFAFPKDILLYFPSLKTPAPGHK